MLKLPEAAFVHQRLSSRDVAHDLALVAVALEEPPEPVQAFVAVVEADGAVLAWDSAIEAPSQITYLRDLPWDEHQDWFSGLLFDANAAWLAAGLGRFLLPSWSIPTEAASLVASWGEALDDGAVRYLSRGGLAAYLPIVDRAAFSAEVDRLRVEREAARRSLFTGPSS